MNENINVEFKKIQDAIAMGQFDIFCQIVKICRETLQNGGIVRIYEDFRSIGFTKELQFNNLNDFNNWLKSIPGYVDC